MRVQAQRVELPLEFRIVEGDFASRDRAVAGPRSRSASSSLSPCQARLSRASPSANSVVDLQRLAGRFVAGLQGGRAENIEPRGVDPADVLAGLTPKVLRARSRAGCLVSNWATAPALASDFVQLVVVWLTAWEPQRLIDFFRRSDATGIGQKRAALGRRQCRFQLRAPCRCQRQQVGSEQPGRPAAASSPANNALRNGRMPLSCTSVFFFECRC